MHLARGAVLVGEAGDPGAVAEHLGGEGAGDDGDVGQAVELALEDVVGAQDGVELEQGDVVDHAGEVDGGLDAGVAAADDGDALALEERAVAVRAVGDALVAVVVLARHVHRAPAGAGGEDDGARPQRGAVGQLDGDVAVVAGGHQAGAPLEVHDVDLVLLHVLLEGGGQLRALGVGHRDEVLDGHRVEHLAAEALGRHAGADALAGGVDGGGGAGGAAADDEDLEGVLLGDGGGVALGRARRRACRRSARGSCARTPTPRRRGTRWGRPSPGGRRPRPGTTQPSIAVWVMLGLRMLIRFRACTTSGQFWQVSEK